jgi:hypothetical protein
LQASDATETLSRMRVLTAVAVFGPLSALITQQPVAAPSASKAPKPAIVLLLKRPITLDADAARSRWARIVDGKVEATPQTTNAWLQADGADLVGGRDGVRFVVRAGAARDLDDHALRHLDDDNKKQVRSHSATLEVACTNDLPADADRRTSYRVLGSVAAALSARGVVGLGAADHGTFDPAPPPGDLRDKLLGEDPLGWLAPILNSSLVVFTRKQFALDESDLEAKLAKEFGVVFGSEDAEHFVVVDDRMTMIKVGDALVILTQRPAIASMKQAAAKYEDLRLRKAIGEHESMLHLATHGAATEAAESQRRCGTTTSWSSRGTATGRCCRPGRTCRASCAPTIRSRRCSRARSSPWSRRRTPPRWSRQSHRRAANGRRRWRTTGPAARSRRSCRSPRRAAARNTSGSTSRASKATSCTARSRTSPPTSRARSSGTRCPARSPTSATGCSCATAHDSAASR